MKRFQATIAATLVVLAASFGPPPASAADYTVERIILAPRPFAGDSFGQSITDIGGNVAVGVPDEQAGGPGTQAFDDGGIVYLFEAGSGEVVRTFVSPDPIDGGNFGETTASLNGNLLVGSPGEPGGGVVYLFDGRPASCYRPSNRPA